MLGVAVPRAQCHPRQPSTGVAWRGEVVLVVSRTSCQGGCCALQTGGEDPLDKYCGDNPDADECRCDPDAQCVAGPPIDKICVPKVTFGTAYESGAPLSSAHLRNVADIVY